MEEGLAAMYGNGEGNNTKHYYAGAMKKKKCKKKGK
jgi:hypothetical protein